MNSMFRLFLASAAVLFFAPINPAFAGNAHFIKKATTAELSGIDLVVSFKEAGLESGSVETITVSATFIGTFQCVNGGGNVPSDPKKTKVVQDVAESGQFKADKNGNVTGSLTLFAPSGEDVGFSCPPGQKEVLSDVSYSNVLIADETSGASLNIPGVFQ